MKHIFLDTNILLDVILRRKGFLEAAEVMNLGERDDVEVCASYLTFANTAYVLRKYPKDEMYSILSEMAQGINILPMTAEQLYGAIANPVSDFEDMLQYQCAKAYGCEAVVTGNIRHWQFSDIPVFTSSEFLEYLKTY